MKMPTPRTDECLGGNAHGNAIELLARQLEREAHKLREFAGKLLEDLKRRTPDRADSSLPEWEREAHELSVPNDPCSATPTRKLETL